jgi:hypothetical protein
MKDSLKVAAQKLRKKGKSYSEIMAVIPVAKSTLSVWFSEVALTKRQKKTLSDRSLAAAQRGAERKKKQRIESTIIIKNTARMEIGSLTRREMLLVGAALYWAEGSKEKEGRYGVGVIFANSDPSMVLFFLRWLETIVGVAAERIDFELYVHEAARFRLHEIRDFWVKALRVKAEKLQTVYFKRGQVLTNRKNTGKEYYGLVRIRVRRSTDLNRRIMGWVDGICGSTSVSKK